MGSGRRPEKMGGGALILNRKDSQKMREILRDIGQVRTSQ